MDERDMEAEGKDRKRKGWEIGRKKCNFWNCDFYTGCPKKCVLTVHYGVEEIIVNVRKMLKKFCANFPVFDATITLEGNLYLHCITVNNNNFPYFFHVLLNIVDKVVSSTPILGPPV
jgi:hypothetical protein